jgi:hypothetical protein
MKTLLVAIPVFFLSLFLYTKLVGPIPFSVNQVTTTKTDLFSVTGTGKVSATPDIARISVGIEESGSTVKTAQDKMNTVINTVSESIKKLGIDKKDIKTTNYSINPQYDYTNGRQKIVGYNAQTDLQIIVRQLDKVNSVIDSATANGANTVGGISFDVEDKQKAENEARKLAVDEARQKAENAAKTAGFTLGRMVNYQESFGGGAIPRPYLMAAKGEADSAVSTQIEPGSQELTITVTLSYELR